MSVFAEKTKVRTDDLALGRLKPPKLAPSDISHLGNGWEVEKTSAIAAIFTAELTRNTSTVASWRIFCWDHPR